MKIMKKFISAMAVTGLLFGTVTYAESNKPVIILDAGHHYGETYKSSPDGYLEVTYNMDILKLVKQYIEEQRPNVKIIETNPNGTNTGRADRGKFAIDKNADLLVSLHMNVVGGSENVWQNEISGAHIIVDNNACSQTIDLANDIINDYLKETGFKAHMTTGFEIRDDGPNQISMLDVASKGNVKAMLLEMGFMDHEEQAMYFRTEEGKQKVARAIANSIIKNFIDKIQEYPTELPMEEPKEEIDLDEAIYEIIDEVFQEEIVEDILEQDISKEIFIEQPVEEVIEETYLEDTIKNNEESLEEINWVEPEYKSLDQLLSPIEEETVETTNDSLNTTKEIIEESEVKVKQLKEDRQIKEVTSSLDTLNDEQVLSKINNQDDYSEIISDLNELTDLINLIMN